LYYRLNVFPVRLPPLRERKDDIPLLVHFLVNKFKQRTGKHLDEVSQRTLQRLQEYPWPGNIRELENVLERAVILATGSILDIDPDHLPLPAPPVAQTRPNPADPVLPRPGGEGGVRREDAEGTSSLAVAKQAPGQSLPSLEAVERDYILTVLGHTDWVIT